MALNKAGLVSAIKTLCEHPGGNTSQQFADGLATAIETYVKSGTVTVAAGIGVAVAGTATAQTGATNTTGTGTIS